MVRPTGQDRRGGPSRWTEDHWQQVLAAEELLTSVYLRLSRLVPPSSALKLPSNQFVVNCLVAWIGFKSVK